jgi:hypothetical protein
MAMADIDNIPLDVEQVPILVTYEPGPLWDPEEGAPNADWHVMMRTHLDLAEEEYEKQFDAVVAENLRVKRQAVLLAAFTSRLISTALMHGFQNGTAQQIEGGVQVTDPLLIDFDNFIREYQSIEGAAVIRETEGFIKWNALDEAKKADEARRAEETQDVHILPEAQNALDDGNVFKHGAPEDIAVMPETDEVTPVEIFTASEIEAERLAKKTS